MKTTLIRCVNACMAVNYLSQMEWDYKTAFTLARLRRALQPSVDFYIREENIVDRIEFLHFLVCDFGSNIPCVRVKKTSLRKVCAAYFILRTAEFGDT